MRLTKNKFIHQTVCTLLAGFLLLSAQPAIEVYASPETSSPPNVSYSLSSDPQNHAMIFEPLVTSTEEFQVYLKYPDSEDWEAIDNSTSSLTQVGDYQLKAVTASGAESDTYTFSISESDLLLTYDESWNSPVMPLHDGNMNQADSLLWTARFPSAESHPQYPDGTYESYWIGAVHFAVEKGTSSAWNSATHAFVQFTNGSVLNIPTLSPYLGVGRSPDLSYYVMSGLPDGEYGVAAWDLLDSSGNRLGNRQTIPEPFGLDTQSPSISYSISPVNGGQSYRIAWSASDAMSGAVHCELSGGPYNNAHYWTSSAPKDITVAATTSSFFFIIRVYDKAGNSSSKFISIPAYNPYHVKAYISRDTGEYGMVASSKLKLTGIAWNSGESAYDPAGVINGWQFNESPVPTGSWNAGSGTNVFQTTTTVTRNGRYYLHIRGANGTTSTEFVDVNWIDNVPPVVTVTWSKKPLRQDTLIVSAQDDTAITGYMITTTSTKPSASDPGWQDSGTFTNKATQNIKYYCWAKDEVGNVGGCIADVKSLDLYPPVIQDTLVM